MLSKAEQHRLKLIVNNQKILVAVSGGVDSIVLLHTLVNLCEPQNLANIYVIHFNHQLREESSNEYKEVKKLCQELQVVFNGYCLDVYDYCDKQHKSLETGARELRYQYFEEIAKEKEINYIFLGHHGDDLIETVLMRMVKGSHDKGLIGMSISFQKDELIYERPFLHVTKSQIYQEAYKNKYVFFEDKTNSDLFINRNRYRKNVLPFLKTENYNVHEAFLMISEERKEDEEYFDSIINTLSEQQKHYHVLHGYKKEFFNQQPLAIRKRLLKNWIHKVMGKDYFYRNNLLNDVQKYVEKHISSDFHEISKDLYVLSDHDILWFCNKQELQKYLMKIEKNLPNNLKPIKKPTEQRYNGKRLSKLFSELKISPAFRKGYVEIENEEITHVYNIFLDKIK